MAPILFRLALHRWRVRTVTLTGQSLAVLVILGPVDLASGKAAIENVNRRGAAVR